MSEYDKIADRATSEPCIACKQAAWIAKYVRHGAVLPTIGCTCVAHANLIADAAPYLLAALEGMQQANGCFDDCRWEYSGRHHAICLEATYAIAIARGSV